MQSHRYEFVCRDVLRTMGWPLIPVTALAIAIQTGARWSLLPPPRPALDTERTILVHQVDAARQTHRVDILLLGDSSCLTGVSARRLGERLGRPALSLATFSFLDLHAQALLLEEFNGHHATGPQAVVLLMHPEALRRVDSESYYWRVLTNYCQGLDDLPAESWGDRMRALSGMEIVQGRLLSRALPVPLSGAYGRRYGFSRDLEEFLSREQGSLLDPEAQPFVGAPEYRLAPTLEKASGRFRAAVRPGVKLLVGMTPVPARFAGPRFPAQQAQMLRQWGNWLRADGLLDSLPATKPDEAFTRTTHLRETEVTGYTDLLAAAVRSKLQANP